MKKILFIYYQNIKQGGISKSIANITKSLVDEEYEVTILFLMRSHQDFFPIDMRVKKVYINSFDTKYFRKTHRLNKNLKGKIQKIVNYAYDFGCFSVLKDWIEKNHNRYDEIITCWYKLSIYLTFTSASHKTVAWEHINHKTGGLIYFNLLKKRYSKLKSIICLTDDSANFYKKYHTKIIKISNIIGDQFENCELDLNSKEDKIFFASRMDPEKNVKEFLEIIAETKLQQSWNVTIAGTGIEVNEIKRYAAKLKINNLNFLRSISSEEMLDYYKKSKIFCMTSLSEGLPTTLIEAMFCGNSLISYDCPTGPSEIVNKNNGYLITLKENKHLQANLNFYQKIRLSLQSL